VVAPSHASSAGKQAGAEANRETLVQFISAFSGLGRIHQSLATTDIRGFCFIRIAAENTNSKSREYPNTIHTEAGGMLAGTAGPACESDNTWILQGEVELL
jgi:hypothetical protein